MSPRLVLAAQLVAFWPVWRWCAERLRWSSESRVEIVALAVGVALVALRLRGVPSRAPAPLGLATALTALFAATHAWLPPIARALVAAVALASAASALAWHRRLHPGLAALALLALPLLPILRFHLGFPLRVVAASLAAALLRLEGLAVARVGTALDWNGTLVGVDAPCSGIRMLWAALLLASGLACLHDAGTWRTLALLAATSALVVLTNALRAAALFHLESGLVAGPAWAHDGIGVVLYVATLAGVIACAARAAGPAERERGGVPCAPAST